MNREETSPSSDRKMPIHEDTQVRSIVDALDENQETPDWYPVNGMTRKLWHCLEALRDINVALENVSKQQDANKWKREMKLLSVPLHSLAKSIESLCDQIASDADARHRLGKCTLAQVSKIKSEFKELIPTDHKGDLSVLRNRLAGHIDKNLSPAEAREILSRKAMSKFGQWLHICMHALLDLIKLDIYAWSVHSPIKWHIRLMSCEPFLVTFLFDEEIKEILAVHLAKRSPRMTIVDVVAEVVERSQWMFENGQPRIGPLKADRGNEWNTFKGCTAIWR